MNNYENLMKAIDDYRQRNGLKKADLLRMVADDPEAEKSKFYKALKGTSIPSGAALVDWLTDMGFTITPPDERLDDYVMVPKVKAVAGAGASLETNGDVAGFYAFREEFLKREGISTKNSVMMLVRGDSMDPLIKDGDTILIDQTCKKAQDGGIFVVGFDDELMVKRLQRVPTGWLVRSENESGGKFKVEGDEEEKFRIYGRVRWFGRVL